MISLNTLSSRRSPIGKVLRQVVRGCSSRRMMCHHHSSPFPACDSQGGGSDKPNEVCLSTKDATSIVGCNLGFHAGKRSEGKVSLPLCSLTIWYYHYALSLCITKPDPASAWHSELNTSLGTTTRNHNQIDSLYPPGWHVPPVTPIPQCSQCSSFGCELTCSFTHGVSAIGTYHPNPPIPNTPNGDPNTPNAPLCSPFRCEFFTWSIHLVGTCHTQFP